MSPEAKNYNRFTGVLTGIAKKHIPRGYRKEYIPGWSQESEDLYNEYQETNDNLIADELLSSLSKTRREKWIKTVEYMDFKKSSRKAWNLLRKIDPNSKRKHSAVKIKANNFANRIIELFRAKVDKNATRNIKKELKELKANAEITSNFANDFTEHEIQITIQVIKTGKAAGFDEVYPEFLKNCGPKTRQWLETFFTNILRSGRFPKQFKKTKILAILKPGKPDNDIKRYRPISLLSVNYKIFERLIYNCIAETVNKTIPTEQAGFRPHRNCYLQSLSLTANIEDGIEKGLKSAAVFIDLTAAYDI